MIKCSCVVSCFAGAGAAAGPMAGPSPAESFCSAQPVRRRPAGLGGAAAVAVSHHNGRPGRDSVRLRVAVTRDHDLSRLWTSESEAQSRVPAPLSAGLAIES